MEHRLATAYMNRTATRSRLEYDDARGGYLSAPWRHALFALFIGGILAYGAAFAWYMLANFDLVNLLHLNIDDAFYYFKIAQYLAEGEFSTFDGGISRTNGYHPLWLFMITPFYWVFDKEAALFAIKALEIMLIAGSVALIATAARFVRLPWYLMFAALPMLNGNHGMLIGMEAAASLFMLSLLFLTLCLYIRGRGRSRWLLASVVFVLPWVRLEYVAISLTATTALCFIEWLWQDRQPGASLRARARSIPVLNATVPFLAACAGILVYFAYNWLVFGGILPVSGVSKTLWALHYWEQEGGKDLVRNVQEMRQYHAFDNDVLLLSLGICICLPLVWWLTLHLRGQKDRLFSVFLVGAFSLATGHLAKFAHAVFTMHPSLGWNLEYFALPPMMRALAVPLGCYVALHLVRHCIAKKSVALSNILSVGIIVVSVGFLLTKADFSQPFRKIDWASDSLSPGWEISNYMGTQVMNRILPEDSVVGSWDAGVVGYFSHFPVVNLDGVVNSYEYLRGYRKAGYKTPSSYTRYDDAEPFFSKFGITYFANLHGVDDKLDKTMFIGGRFIGEPKRSFTIWSVKPLGAFDPAAWLAQKGSHFDYQSDGVGLILDSRTVQAFAQNCETDNLVLWLPITQGMEVVKTMGVWRQTPTGLCTADMLLPRNALPPRRVEKTSMGDYVKRLVGDIRPAIRSKFDVYLQENQNRLIYVRETCSDDDISTQFFLHTVPVDVNNLAEHRRRYAFDNLDFNFSDFGIIVEGICLAVRELPDYDFLAVRTGQYTPDEGQIWKGSFDFAESVGVQATAP